jgi:hypothetical protein
MLCTGFMVLKAVDANIQLMREWEHELELASIGSSVNQYHFNSIIKSYLTSPSYKVHSYRLLPFRANACCWCQVRILPYEDFPAGSLYFNIEWRASLHQRPVAVHVNFVVGHGNKKDMMKDVGLWHSDG